MEVWACVQAWACLGERRAAGGGSVWYAAKRPPEAGADASMVLCCRLESSRCTMPSKEDTLRLQGCCWRREHDWMQWIGWVHGSVGMCTSMGMPGRVQGWWWGILWYAVKGRATCGM